MIKVLRPYQGNKAEERFPSTHRIRLTTAWMEEKARKRRSSGQRWGVDPGKPPPDSDLRGVPESAKPGLRSWVLGTAGKSAMRAGLLYFDLFTENHKHPVDIGVLLLLPSSFPEPSSTFALASNNSNI